MDELKLIESYGWNTLGGHDPTMIQDRKSGLYYLFSTDSVVEGTYTSGIQVRKSADRIHWEYLGTAFEGVPEEAFAWTNAEGLWAPEIIEYEGQYRMYYSASTFGSTTSCIGLATAPELQGPWEHQALVVRTDSKIAAHNAIDANVVWDKEGKMWLCYGSFFGGIYLLQLDPQSGLPLEADDFGICIAKRDRSILDGAIEGAFIFHHEELDYYYLFSSYDSLFDTYNVRVARSRTIQGPYLDQAGNSMLQTELHDSVGTKVLGSYQFAEDIAWMAPGHNSIFQEAGNKNTYMVHHVRIASDLNKPLTFIRKIHWLKNGWPVVSPEYISGAETASDSGLPVVTVLAGDWELVRFAPENNKLVKAECERFLDRQLQFIDDFGTGDFYDNLTGSHFRIWKGFNWKKSETEWQIAGMDAQGNTFFGKKV
nr:arabinan endo-1,5-alpha-L-arabinosidase [uncultured Trichococcus sp.]